MNEEENMKRKSWLIALCFASLTVMFAPQSCFAEKLANTIDELVKMYDDTKCWECHTDQHDEWKTSFHSNPINSSLGGIRNFIMIGLAKEWNTPLTKAQILKCLDCHAPVVNFASEKLAVQIAEMIVTANDKKGTPEAEAVTKELAKLNVGCTACHNIKATATAQGLRGKAVHGKIYSASGYGNDEHDTVEAVELKRSIFCMQCHGIYSAPDGEKIQCNTLSGSYQDAYNNLGGTETCQDCHMKDNKHNFPGGHDKEIVAEGLGLNVQITQYRHLPGQVETAKNQKAWVPSAVVTAFVENKAGHRIPDG